MWNLLVEIICAFLPKKNRFNYNARQFLRHITSYIHIKRRTKYSGKNIRLGGKVYINKNTVINDNTTMGNLRVIGRGDFSIGKYTSIGEDLLAITGNHNYEGEKIPFDEKWIDKGVEIGEYCWLGTRVTLLPGTKIGEGAIIQAGAVVHGIIPPYSIAGGNPAKVFKYRDKEHFLKLKEEKKFYS